MTYECMYDNTSKRHAHRAQWCAVVTSCVSHGAHAIGHSGLRIVQIVREDIRSVP